MKLPTGQLFLLLLLALSFSTRGQSVRKPSFRAIAYLKQGGSVSGVPDHVEKGTLVFTPYNRIYYRHVEFGKGSVALNQVKHIVIKRTDKRHAVRNGWVIGGALGGYIAFRSLQKNPLRSPGLASVNIIATIGVFGMAGGVVGLLFSPSARLTLRPNDPENPALSLEQQLKPFTKSYLDTLRLEVR